MNPGTFRDTAISERSELVAFLNELEQRTQEEITTAIAAADKAAWQETDCLDCANCCKTMTPAFTNEDISRIATHLRITPALFKKKWLKLEPKSGHWVNTSQPCQFLQADNKCSVYPIRPSDCAGFPHHDKQPFNEYSETFKKNVVHCPATYTFVKKLEEIVGKLK